MDRSRVVRVAPVVAAILVLSGCSGAAASLSPATSSYSGDAGTAGPSPSTAAAVVSPPPSTDPSSSSPAPNGRSCVSLAVDFVDDTRGPQGDPVALTRAGIAGLQASDALASEADETGMAVSIRRGGEVVGRVHYIRGRTGAWLMDSALLCDPGLGIGVPTEGAGSPGPSAMDQPLPKSPDAPSAPTAVKASKSTEACPDDGQSATLPCVVADITWGAAPQPAVYRIYETTSGEGAGAACKAAEATLVLTTGPGATSARVGPLAGETGAGARCLLVSAANSAGESPRVRVPGDFMTLP